MSLCSLTSPNPCSTTISITIKNGGQPKNYTSNYLQNSLNWPNNPSIGAAIAGAALSFTLLLSPPLSIAADSPLSDQSSLSSDSYCREDEREFGAEMELSAPKLKTNEGIVEEAWEIVNESFLDTGRSRWSPESWLRKKEDILSTSIKTRSKAHSVVQKMLASLGDPYTRFLSPEEFSKMARYDITGIGLNLREIPASNGSFKLKVLGLVLDGPAQTAGIRQGDEILSVDGEDVRGKSAFEVSSKLQGPSETFVTVEVKHGNCGPVQSVKVQRQMVARPPVFYRLEKIDNGATSVGYVRLKEFNALARKDIVTAMKRLQDLGASCFVLDLRDNFGGLVQAGIEIAKLFLNEGDTVIYTAGRELSQNAFVAESPPLVTAPVMVLVNHNTASASEIVASALHDNCKAVLVGEKTYGKGLIQSVFELHDGSGVVVTIGKYITPHHLDINGNGIEPDFSNIPRWSDVTKSLSTCNRLIQG
ncbi:carboxyl-terminal-processing peptidase 1, chloroplastic-like isoform X2 [Chenopodium quinoa]|uniref:carboxyl-terminal-processing peptidase 1, chloroplastic-like isoform X2 n=1 Tax=Chenopodium quinoa TaxID=63459 RepID=UPI000B770CE0|nr:carboxyl-terminal-processing peptidase 1, chloroplastic-like isoform X2 [Chenopodium quinoa]